jgi:DNA-binding MarR family transcriptional regulator
MSERFYHKVIRMSKRSREELIQEFIAALRASQTAVDLVDEAVADYLGINRTDARCLDILDQEGPMTAGHLADRARISPGAMTTLLDRLERKGLARRTRDTEDRRRVLVEVTPELRAMARELYGSADDDAQALSALSDEQLEFLIEFNRQSVAYQENLIRRLEAAKASRSP